METTDTRPGTRLSRRIALTAAGALTVAGLGMVNAAPASAETLTATGGAMTWGFRTSTLAYHVNHFGDTQLVTMGDGLTAAGATQGTAPETYATAYNWPFASGTYDDVAKTYTAQYGGSLTLTDSNPNPTTGPSGPSPFKYLKIANPKVVINFTTGTKELYVTVTPGPNEGPAEPSGPASEVNFANLTVPSEALPTGGTIAYSGVTAVVSAAGSAGFGGFLPTGSTLEPIDTSLTGLAGPGNPDPCVENPTAPGCGDPDPGPNSQTITFSVPQGCDGDVTWAITDDGAVQMTEAVVSGNKLTSTGTIDPIQVTDSRVGNGAACTDPFEISGQVSDFEGPGTLSGRYLGWSPTIIDGNLVKGPDVASGFGSETAPGLSTPSVLASSTQQGQGQAGAGLTLDMPVDTEPGQYSATLTLTGLN